MAVRFTRSLIVSIQRRALMTFALLATSCSFALAQPFPSKPIRLIVPFPPASNPDVLARLLAESVGARLKQPIVVDNKPGAGGMIGTDAGAKAPADGYTLLVGDSGPLAIAPWLYAKVPFGPTKDLVGVAALVKVPIVMIVPRTSSATTPSDLVAQAKAHPGQLLYGSLGVGSIHHLAVEVLSATTGIKLTHIPYKSNGELTAAVVNGDVQMAFSGIPSVQGFIKDNRLRAIAISTANRSAAFPDLKTLHEQGIQGFDVAPTIGIVAPSGVPADRLKVLEEAFLAAMKDPTLAERIGGLGMVPTAAGGAAYQNVIASELERYGRIVKEAGVQPQ
jgi:tripartite-type tricarboxylate transporter receptor subunit TctC